MMLMVLVLVLMLMMLVLMLGSPATEGSDPGVTNTWDES